MSTKSIETSLAEIDIEVDLVKSLITCIKTHIYNGHKTEIDIVQVKRWCEEARKALQNIIEQSSIFNCGQ